MRRASGLSKVRQSASWVGCLAILALSTFSLGSGGELRRGPYLQNQTESAVTIMWGTAGTGSSGQVELRGGTTFTTTSIDGENFTIHKARLSDLEGDTDYEYRISTDGVSQTDWIPFHTSKPKSVPFRFAVIGDSGDDPSRQEHQVNIAAQMLTSLPDLWLHTGDMAVDGCLFNGFEAVTARHFGVYQELNKSRPHYPSAGNHELDGPDRGAHFRNSFDFPGTGPAGHEDMSEVYSASYGDLWFATVSTGGSWKESGFDEIKASLGNVGWQYNWLKDKLENEAQAYTWKLVMHHRQSYTSAMRYHDPHTSYAHEELLAITELCEDYGVDIIAFGHAHSLQRSKPVYRGQVDYEKGVIHLDTSGGGKTNVAGPGQYDDFWTDFVCGDRWGFFQGDVTYDGDQSTLTLTCIDEYGEVIESATGSSGIWTKTKQMAVLGRHID